MGIAGFSRPRPLSAACKPFIRLRIVPVTEAPFLLIERDGPVVITTLNRPDERNAISKTEYSEESAAFCAEMTRDMSVRAKARVANRAFRGGAC